MTPAPAAKLHTLLSQALSQASGVTWITGALMWSCWRLSGNGLGTQHWCEQARGPGVGGGEKGVIFRATR